MLAHPFVAPTAQNQGVGRALLEHTLAYAKESEPGLIVSSPEPRAIRRYASAGFALVGFENPIRAVTSTFARAVKGRDSGIESESCPSECPLR